MSFHLKTAEIQTGMKDLLQVAPTTKKKKPKNPQQKNPESDKSCFSEQHFFKSEKMLMPFQLTQAYHIGLYSQDSCQVVSCNYTSTFLKENISHWGKL